MIIDARRGVARLLVAVSMLLVAVSAKAQLPGASGTGGLRSPAIFGGARGDRSGEDSVWLAVNLLGGYDTNILADNAGAGGGTGGTLGSTTQTGSSFAGGSAQLLWSRYGSRTSYFGSLGGQYRRFLDLDDYDVEAYNAGMGADFRLSRRSSLQLSANAAAQPFYQFQALGVDASDGLVPRPAEGPQFTPDFQAAQAQLLRFGGGAGYSYELGPRTSFRADVRRYGSRPLNSDAEDVGLTNLGQTSAGALVTHGLTTNLGARIGYSYSQFDDVQRSLVLPTEATRTERVQSHNIDVGLTYSRALTLASRTSFRFGTGTNISRNAAGLDRQGVERVADTNFNITGFASLRRDFFRTWSASLNYRRGTSYIEGYNEFAVFDAAYASIVGLFTDRLDGMAGLTYTNGTLGAGRPNDERVATLGAGAQLRYALTSNLAAFLSYTYTRYEVPPDRAPATLVEDYRPDRQGARVGLTVWFDLLR